MADINVEYLQEEIWPDLERFMSTQPYGLLINLTTDEYIKGWNTFDARVKILLILGLSSQFKNLGYKVMTDYNLLVMNVENCAEAAKGKNSALSVWDGMVNELFQYVYGQATMAQHSTKQSYSVDALGLIERKVYPVGYTEAKLLDEVVALLQQKNLWSSVTRNSRGYQSDRATYKFVR